MKEEKSICVSYCGWEYHYLGTKPGVFAGSFSNHMVSLLPCEKQTLSRSQKEGGSGRDRVLAEWEGDAGHGAQGGEPLCTPRTPGPGGFTGRGAGAQVRSETHLSFR